MSSIYYDVLNLNWKLVDEKDISINNAVAHLKNLTVFFCFACKPPRTQTLPFVNPSKTSYEVLSAPGLIIGRLRFIHFTLNCSIIDIAIVIFSSEILVNESHSGSELWNWTICVDSQGAEVSGILVQLV